MPGPRARQVDPMAWWGIIQASATAGETTAELFGRIRSEAERLGVPLPPGGAVAFNDVRSAAVKLREAASNLSDAPDSYAITRAHLAALPYGPGPSATGGPRVFDVRVAYTALRLGQEESDYVTLRYTGGLPATVGELRAEAEDVTASLVEGYGAALTGIGAIQIGEL